MKTLRILVIVSVLFLVPRIFAIEIENLAIEADIKVVSAYAWRGMILNDEACIQPMIVATAGNASLNVWGTWDLTSVSNASSRTRMDVTLDYTFTAGKHLLIPSITSYIYHDSSFGRQKDTFEVSLDYVQDILLLPSISMNYDFGEIEGFYVRAGIAHSFNIIQDKWFLDLKTNIGAGDSKYVDYNFNADSSIPDELSTSLIDLEVSAAFPYLITESFTITPAVRYMTLVGSDIKNAVERDGKDTDQFIYSINCGFFF